MSLRSIEIENYRGIARGRVTLGDTTVVFGENDSGRTRFVEALLLSLGARGEALEDRLRPFHFHRTDGRAARLHIRLHVRDDGPERWPLPRRAQRGVSLVGRRRRRARRRLPRPARRRDGRDSLGAHAEVAARPRRRRGRNGRDSAVAAEPVPGALDPAGRAGRRRERRRRGRRGARRGGRRSDAACAGAPPPQPRRRRRPRSRGRARGGRASRERRPRALQRRLRDRRPAPRRSDDRDPGAELPVAGSRRPLGVDGGAEDRDAAAAGRDPPAGPACPGRRAAAVGGDADPRDREPGGESAPDHARLRLADHRADHVADDRDHGFRHAFSPGRR